MNTHTCIGLCYQPQPLCLWRFLLLMIVLLTTTASCFYSASPLCASGIRCPVETICSVDGESCVRRTCGDSIPDMEAGEMCDLGSRNSDEPDAECRADCLLPRCGDGIVDSGEVCDDGNSLDGDGCSHSCLSDESCGNGIVDIPVGESCDDGNTLDGDQCRADCVTPLCGDGIIDEQFAEACDCGNSEDKRPMDCNVVNSSLADATCRPNCQWGGCGDGIKDSDEVCDDGNRTPGDGCAADCNSNETCGNGYADALVGETCDDGNTVTRDGCSSTCLIEAPAWRQHVAPPISNRFEFAMAYDVIRQRVVLFGGDDGARQADTWAWDGHSWHRIATPGPSPPSRIKHAMAYDVVRGRIVLFGGAAGSHDFGDTWEWDGYAWHPMASDGLGPSPRHDHAMAYDVARGRVVLFGGEHDAERLGDTWEWDGQSWHLLAPHSRGPSGREKTAMAYDSARERVVLFGGLDGTTQNDTWEWDGQSWHSTTASAPPPSPRDDHSMAYDAARGRVVLFGGARTDETWEWDGESWLPMTRSGSPPSPRNDHAMVYDAVGGRITLFGGFDGSRKNDTWHFSYDSEHQVYEGCLNDVDNDGDGLAGCDDADCWAYCTPHCLPHTGACDLSLPHCGDGVCNRALENHLNCPIDCLTVCGNFACEPGESAADCPADCR